MGFEIIHKEAIEIALKVLKYPYGIWNSDRARRVFLHEYGFEVPLWDLKSDLETLIKSELKPKFWSTPMGFEIDK